jgi:hypothetical protein
MEMTDIAGNEVYPGDYIKILQSDYPNFIGKIYKVLKSDNPFKVRVEYNNQWQGYYSSRDIVKVDNVFIKKIEGFDSNKREDIKKLIIDRKFELIEILKNVEHEDFKLAINLIKSMFPTKKKRFDFLNSMDYDIFSTKDWFMFGDIFSKDEVN